MTAAELEFRSRCPPAVLVAMRQLMMGQQATTEEMRVLQEVRKKNPREFLKMVTAAEREYQEHMAALMMKPVEDRPAELEADEGGERCDELTDRLLKEWEDDGK